tara:strand:+ start:147 stop:1673 length:1527 start_codon:yes stop_codon:yes gene_type:complete
MFRRSASSSQPDLFSSFESHFKGPKQNQLNDPAAWHNLFYQHITSEIDEDVFSVLFDADIGRPNAPIRHLVSMMILKEGFGWSDAQLFEQCRFNILVMRALGLMNLYDEVPVESTYYLFKQSLYAYQVKMGRDLVGETFSTLTKTQANAFGVVGQQIRMDSKLIGSNIATCCRLQLVVCCLHHFWRSLDKNQKGRLSAKNQQVLDDLLKVKPHQVVYRLTSVEKGEKLQELGLLLSRLQEAYTDKDSDQYDRILRVFADQYTVLSSQKEVLPKLPEEISSSSLQSVNDADAAFRRKGEDKVKGYSVNLTETCNEEGLNLITDVEVKPATAPDNEFVQPAIERTQQVVGEVLEVSMDGAYNDASNTEYAEKKGKQLHYSGLQGRRGRLIYERTPEGIEVIDRHTGDVQLAQEYKPGKYKIIIDGKLRYFREQDIENYIKRKQIEELPAHIRNRRNNVEASIFQLSYYTKDGKTRYRGLIPHQLWSWCRGLWVNLVRIKNYLTQPELIPA